MSENGKPSQSLFGQHNAPAQSGGSTGLFGGLSGSQNTGTSQSATTTLSTTSPPLFGNAPSKGVFGQGGTLSSNSLKPDDTGTKQGAGHATNLFGGPFTPNKVSEGPSSTLFGSSTGSVTPTSKTFSWASTTPAGPPPSNTSSSLFGSLGGSTSAPGGLFGAASVAEKQNVTTGSSSSDKPSLFSSLGQSNTQGSSTSLFAATSKPSSSPFGSQATTQSNSGATSGPNNATTVPTTSSSGLGQTSLFGAKPSNSTNNPSSASDSQQPSTSSGSFKSPFGFPKSSSSSQDKNNITQPASGEQQSMGTASNGGSNTGLGTQKSTLSNQVAPSASGSSNLFSGIGLKPNVSSSEAASTDTTNAPTSTTLGTSNTEARKASFTPATQNSQTIASTSATPAARSSSHNVGGSFAGPTPSNQSRLKNKSMDEIIVRWASDLSKYQKEFQSQAETVASWDRMLVENSNAISKLYSKTFQAERDTAEVQRQLSAVESQQEELTQWLDHYEREIDEIIGRSAGQGDNVQGPDSDREQTFQIAERVSERLNEMGSELTNMIEEINDASNTISKTSKQDDPLSQIVRILNGHLSQLQLIDQGTSELQAKLRSAQKESQRLGSRGRGALGSRSDAADDFYRSYMSRG